MSTQEKEGKYQSKSKVDCEKARKQGGVRIGGKNERCESNKKSAGREIGSPKGMTRPVKCTILSSQTTCSRSRSAG